MLEWGGLALLGLSLTLIGLGVWGGMLYVAAEDRQERERRHELRRLKLDVQATAARYQVPVPVTFHYTHNPTTTSTYQVRNDPRPELPPGALPPPTVTDLPGPCTLLDVLRGGFTPDKGHILLGIGAGGKLLTAPADEATGHVLLAGQTGGGKTSLFQLLMAQLLAAGVPVWWLDPHFAPLDQKHQEDWRPLQRRWVGGDALREYGAIAQALEQMVGPELARRKAARNATGDPGPVFFMFADEWPGLISADKRIADPATRFVREYRKYNGYLGIGSQDALVETMGTHSGALDQFPTGYFVGGDNAATRKRLGVPLGAPPPPGKGLVYLRCTAQPTAALTRVPHADALSLYELLGWPATPPPWGWPGHARQVWPAAHVVESTAHRVPEASSPAPVGTNAPPVEASTRKEQARQLLAQGIRPAEVVRRLWGLQTNTGRAADEAMGELTGWIAEWVIMPQGE